MKRHRRMTTGVSVAIALSLCGRTTMAEEKTVHTVGDGWKITISPAAEAAPATAATQEDAGRIDPAEYQRIYDSIPFNRAEYRANPSYRHDATIELLFGTLRPTVVHRSARQAPTCPDDCYPTATLVPYHYNRHLQPYGLTYQFYFPYWSAHDMY